MLDQAKAVMKMRKLQKELTKEMIEVEAGEGAVVIKISADQKIKDVTLDSDLIDFDDMSELEDWIETAVKEAITKSQQVAAEKMKPIMGELGNLGL
jgi:DNA-binding YbaB/EbfC family protein